MGRRCPDRHVLYVTVRQQVHGSYLKYTTSSSDQKVWWAFRCGRSHGVAWRGVAWHCMEAEEKPTSDRDPKGAIQRAASGLHRLHRKRGKEKRIFFLSGPASPSSRHGRYRGLATDGLGKNGLDLIRSGLSDHQIIPSCSTRRHASLS